MNIITYFTKQTDVREEILKLLESATTQVLVAVAWFTDRSLFNKLLEIQDRGVNVEVIITRHEFNNQSLNNFNLIEHCGGFFAEVGNDERLMHMKFCVIDFDTVVSGSANWTKRAFTENNEEVTVVTNNSQRAADFTSEFERLKILSGKIKTVERELDIENAIKTLDVIKALISLGDISALQPYIYKIRNIKELDAITSNLLAGNFEKAVLEINDFKKRHSQLISITEIERMQLLIQIKLLSFQIESLQVQKVEIETIIDQFNHRYRIELNPLILKLIGLKKKIYEKLKKHGIFDETYENLENEFKTKNEEYKKEKEIKIVQLNEDDTKTIKQLYREAVCWCHPDSPNCIYEDKKKAGEIFSDLTSAYKTNDLDRVKYIYGELKNGRPVGDFERIDDLMLLRAKLESLKFQYRTLTDEINTLMATEVFRLLSEIKDWDEYFEIQKKNLMNEYDNLQSKYCQNEQ